MNKITLALLLASSPALQAAPSFTNGSLDSGTDWSLTQSFGCATFQTTTKYEGTGSFKSGCTDGSVLSQTITGLTVGGEYTLSYWLKFAPLGMSVAKPTFTSKFGSTTLQSITSDAAFDWTQSTYQITAANASETLRVDQKVVKNGSYWYLDDVRLTAIEPPAPVSAPGTLALAMAGGLLAFRRKFK